MTKEIGPRPAFTLFLSGVIQGSNTNDDLHTQTYREVLRDLVKEIHPEADVICPVEQNPKSGEYNEELAREAFMQELELAASADVTVAYAPVATMGTAVEMYRAYAAGRLVFAISPMARNWAVRFLSTRVFENVAAFETFVRSGALGRALVANKATVARETGC